MTDEIEHYRSKGYVVGPSVGEILARNEAAASARLDGETQIVGRQEFFIPDWRPISLNKLLACSLRRRIQIKKTDNALIGLYVQKCGIIKAGGKRRVSLEITLTSRQKKCDFDNLWKVLLDSLVKCWALVDDSEKYCETGSVDWFKVGKEFGRNDRKAGTTIILEDL